MDKIVNVGDIEAREFEANWNRDPNMRNLLLFQFYGYCMNITVSVLAAGTGPGGQTLAPNGAT